MKDIKWLWLYLRWEEKAIHMQQIRYFHLLMAASSIISKREQDLLLSCGEIISSVVFTNMY